MKLGSRMYGHEPKKSPEWIHTFLLLTLRDRAFGQDGIDAIHVKIQYMVEKFYIYSIYPDI